MACTAGFENGEFFFQEDAGAKKEVLLKLSGKCGRIEKEKFQGLLVNNLRERGTGNQSMSYAMILMQILNAQWQEKRPFLVLKLGGNILDDLIADLADFMKMLYGESQVDAIQVWDPLKILIKPYDAIILDDVTAKNALQPHHFEVVPKLLRPEGRLFLLTDRQVMKDQMAKDFPDAREFTIGAGVSLLVSKPQGAGEEGPVKKEPAKKESAKKEPAKKGTRKEAKKEAAAK